MPENRNDSVFDYFTEDMAQAPSSLSQEGKDSTAKPSASKQTEVNRRKKSSFYETHLAIPRLTEIQAHTILARPSARHHPANPTCTSLNTPDLALP